MCTSAESFISSSTTSLLSLFGAKLWLGLIATLASQSYSLFASILKFLCVCVIYLYTSNLLISTRQRTSSLDRYLTLQQLEFRLHSLCITPHQAPHKKTIVIGTLCSCIRLAITFSCHHTFVFLVICSRGIHKSFGG